MISNLNMKLFGQHLFTRGSSFFTSFSAVFFFGGVNQLSKSK